MSMPANPALYRKLIQRGLLAALALAVLSVLEFILAKEIDDPTWYMVPFMIAKGLVILQVFMHVGDLRSGGEH